MTFPSGDIMNTDHVPPNGIVQLQIGMSGCACNRIYKMAEVRLQLDYRYASASHAEIEGF